MLYGAGGLARQFSSAERCQTLSAMSTAFNVFRNVTPCSLVFYIEAGCGMFLQDVGNQTRRDYSSALLQDVRLSPLCPRRLMSSGM
jgi:hypothetical protein